MLLSCSHISSAVIITSYSIVSCPALPLWSCVSTMSPLPPFLSVPHFCCLRPRQTRHLRFHCHFNPHLPCCYFALLLLFHIFYCLRLSSSSIIILKLYCSNIHCYISPLSTILHLYHCVIFSHISNIPSL